MRRNHPFVLLAIFLGSWWPSAGVVLPKVRAGSDGEPPLPLLDNDGTHDELYHLHIPKAAGFSFAHNSDDVLEKHGFHTISHEGCIHDQDSNPRLKGSMVMLRRPRSLLLSMYQMCNGIVGKSYKTAVDAGGPPLPDFPGWIDAWDKLRENGFHGDFAPPVEPVSSSPTGTFMETSVRNMRMAAWGFPPFSRGPYTKLNPSEWPRLDGGGTVLHATQLPFRCYSAINPQVQRLTCSKALTLPATYDPELAVRNMQDLAFVGLTEAYQSSICLLISKFEKDVPSYCDCQNETAWATFSEHFKRNALTDMITVTPQAVEDFPQETLEQIDSLTKDDRVLYMSAWQRFLEEVHEVEVKRGTKIFCAEKVHWHEDWRHQVEDMIAAIDRRED